MYGSIQADASSAGQRLQLEYIKTWHITIVLWEILTICSVCTCRSSWGRTRANREPIHMALIPCRWQNTLGHRIGRKSPETEQNVYHLEYAIFFLPPLKALQPNNKGPSHLFVAILLLMGHYFGSCYKSAGQAFSLSSTDHWLLGSRAILMSPWLHATSHHHPSLSQSLEGVLSWTLVKIWCIVKWNRVMRNWYWRGGGYWVLMVGEQRYSNGP